MDEDISPKFDFQVDFDHPEWASHKETGSGIAMRHLKNEYDVI